MPNLKDRERNKRKENYDKVQELKNKGYCPNKIAKMLGLSASVTYRYFKGEVNPYMDLPYKKVNQDIINKVISMYLTGKNYSEISRNLEISRATVKNILDCEYANIELTK